MSDAPAGWEYVATYATPESASEGARSRADDDQEQRDYTVRWTEGGMVNLYRRERPEDVTGDDPGDGDGGSA
jgi:hypothetical protein